MEMEKLDKEKGEDQGDEGTSTQLPQAKGKEKAEPSVYSTLQTPDEDIYSEAFVAQPSSKKQMSDKQRPVNVRIYIGLCILFSAICLFLVLIIVVLAMKSEPPVCSEKAIKDQEMCSLQICEEKFFKSCKGFPEFKTSSPVYGDQCPRGWWLLENSCFFFSVEKHNWEESRRFCQADGGDLAVITSQNVQNRLSKVINMTYWIGLKRSGTQWTWVNNDPVGVSYWSPDAQREGCGILKTERPSDKNWNAVPCTAVTYYICEKRP